MNSLEEITFEIDKHVASAQRATEESKASEEISHALTLACAAMKQVSRLLDKYSVKILHNIGLGVRHKTIEFIEVVRGQEDLQMFATAQAMEQFLDAAREPLVKQSGYPPKIVAGLIKQASDTYTDFMGSKVSVETVRETCKELSNFFCSPPDDNGLPPRPKPPKGPKPVSGHSIVLRYTLALSTLIGSVAALTKAIEGPKEPAKEPAPIVVPIVIQLLTLLICIGLKKHIEAEWGIPAEVPVKTRELVH